LGFAPEDGVVPELITTLDQDLLLADPRLSPSTVVRTQSTDPVE